MLYQDLDKIIKDNNISKDVKLMSDSGWECDSTDIVGVFYNKSANTIVFTSEVSRDEYYVESPDWICLKRKA